MHSQLEAYLEEVATHLDALPVKQRNEELREMQAHLENAVIVSRELGQSEEEAVANVVMQFGTPEHLGGNLVWAWRRGDQRQNNRLFWKMTGCSAAFCTAIGLSESINRAHHGVDVLLLFFFLATILLSIWRCLPSKYLPAWWVWAISAQRPLPWTLRFILIAAGMFLCLNPFSIAYPLWMYVLKPAYSTLGLFSIFYWYYREYQKCMNTIISE